jgi:hypothetical protein
MNRMETLSRQLGTVVEREDQRLVFNGI